MPFRRFVATRRTAEAHLRTRRPLVRHAIAVLIFGMLGATTAMQGAIMKVVAVGDPTPIGGTFSNAPDPYVLGINDRGQVLFGSGVSGGASDFGIFLFSNGAIRKIVANGDPTPVGGVFGPDFQAKLNKWGDVAFLTQIHGVTDGVGVFLYSAGILQRVVTDGDQAPVPNLVDPKADPDIFTNPLAFDLNDEGDIAIFGRQGKPTGLARFRLGWRNLPMDSGNDHENPHSRHRQRRR